MRFRCGWCGEDVNPETTQHFKRVGDGPPRCHVQPIPPVEPEVCEWCRKPIEDGTTHRAIAPVDDLLAKPTPRWCVIELEKVDA